MSMMQEGTYAHRAALWKNGLIFMFPVHRIMTKIHEVILLPYFYFSESSYEFVKYFALSFSRLTLVANKSFLDSMKLIYQNVCERPPSPSPQP